MSNANMPANPVKGCDDRFIDDTEENKGWMEACKPSIGLTKREQFAAMAMQGFAANPEQYSSVTIMAEDSVRWADTLLKALDNE